MTHASGSSKSCGSLLTAIAESRPHSLSYMSMCYEQHVQACSCACKGLCDGPSELILCLDTRILLIVQPILYCFVHKL